MTQQIFGTQLKNKRCEVSAWFYTLCLKLFSMLHGLLLHCTMISGNPEVIQPRIWNRHWFPRTTGGGYCKQSQARWCIKTEVCAFNSTFNSLKPQVAIIDSWSTMPSFLIVLSHIVKLPPVDCRNKIEIVTRLKLYGSADCLVCCQKIQTNSSCFFHCDELMFYSVLYLLSVHTISGTSFSFCAVF